MTSVSQTDDTRFLHSPMMWEGIMYLHAASSAMQSTSRPAFDLLEALEGVVGFPSALLQVLNSN